MIKIEEDVKIGDIILEKGDKIRVLEESISAETGLIAKIEDERIISFYKNDVKAYKITFSRRRVFNLDSFDRFEFINNEKGIYYEFDASYEADIDYKNSSLIVSFFIDGEKIYRFFKVQKQLDAIVDLSFA